MCSSARFPELRPAEATLMSRLALYTGRPLRGPIRTVAGAARTLSLSLFNGSTAIDLTAETLEVRFDMVTVAGRLHLSRVMTLDDAAIGHVSVALTDIELAEAGDYICRVYVVSPESGVRFALPSGELGLLLSVAGAEIVGRTWLNTLIQAARDIAENVAATLGFRNEAETFRNEAEVFRDEAEAIQNSIGDVGSGTGYPPRIYHGTDENDQRSVNAISQERDGQVIPLDFAVRQPDGRTRYDVMNHLEPGAPVGGGALPDPGAVGGTGSITFFAPPTRLPLYEVAYILAGLYDDSASFNAENVTVREVSSGEASNPLAGAVVTVAVGASYRCGIRALSRIDSLNGVAIGRTFETRSAWVDLGTVDVFDEVVEPPDAIGQSPDPVLVRSVAPPPSDLIGQSPDPVLVNTRIGQSPDPVLVPV
ncbi:MAG: hypothetical protein Rubg2KO_15570 [Rubricoccaceae bacterium]